MLWRAGKQPFPTLSAAEAELTEATEALIMGDSFDAILTDLFENYPKSLMIDNQAAIQLISEENGAWRTRHESIPSEVEVLKAGLASDSLSWSCHGCRLGN